MRRASSIAHRRAASRGSAEPAAGSAQTMIATVRAAASPSATEPVIAGSCAIALCFKRDCGLVARLVMRVEREHVAGVRVADDAAGELHRIAGRVGGDRAAGPVGGR